MAQNQITTTLVISFESQAGSGAHLSAEIDGRPDGFNNGITQFIFGDSPVYLVWSSNNVTYTQRTSAGVTSPYGNTIYEVDEQIQFTETREASLSKPPSSGVVWTNLGGDAASFTVKGTQVIASRSIFGVYRAQYSTSPRPFRLSGVTQVGNLSSLNVLILIKGTYTGPAF